MDTVGKKRFPLREAYAFAGQKGLTSEVEDIRTMEIEWDRPYGPTVRRGRMIELFREHNLLDAFIAAHWTYGQTKRGESELRHCVKIKNDFNAFEASGSDPEDEASDSVEEASLEFVLEAHLRDTLAKNIERVEKGLRLYSAGGNSGVEFPVDGGRIDLLAVDRNGKYVAIELKLSRGRNKTLGQLLYYMGWVDKHLGNGPCRGIIIASDISDELEVAAARVPGVSLARYKMNFAIEPLGA